MLKISGTNVLTYRHRLLSYTPYGSTFELLFWFNQACNRLALLQSWKPFRAPIISTRTNHEAKLDLKRAESALNTANTPLICRIEDLARIFDESTAAVAFQNPRVTIVVKGFTDDKGPDTYNRQLSEFRANIVKSYLVGQGMSPKRV